MNNAVAIKDLKPGTIAVLGVPFDTYSSFMKGSAKAPGTIRKALKSKSTNLCTENGVDLQVSKQWRDIGDVPLTAAKNAFSVIEKTVSRLLDKEIRIISLGGDHSITFPIIKAYAKNYPDLHILHFDAHPDLYEELDGNRFSHACPFARIMEQGLAKRLVQAGVRTMTPGQRLNAARFGVEVVEMRNWQSVLKKRFNKPVYLSFDMDALDPAFAPGVSHYEPGGFTTREVLTVIQDVRADIVGADIVEMNPRRDRDGITAMTAAKILKEIIAKMLDT